MVPEVAADASEEKYGYLEWWKCAIILFSWEVVGAGGGCCSKTCAVPVKSTVLQNSSHTRDRKDDSSAVTVRASVRAFEGEKESPPEGLSYGAGDSSRSGGGWEDDPALV